MERAACVCLVATHAQAGCPPTLPPRLLWAVELRPGVCSMQRVGQGALWVGLANGRLAVLDAATGRQARPSWQAHLFPVISITAVGSVVFSLAEVGDGSAWVGLV